MDTFESRFRLRVRMMDVVITDCNHDPDDPNPVFVEMVRLLGAEGVHLSVDNCWSDDFVKADLLIGADPIPDSEVILDARILGQRTLNRFSRLQVASDVNGPVARFCSPANEGELRHRAGDWGDLAVLKYDWSMRRNGVFLWPLDQPRRPFPSDFSPGRDLFMEFLPGDPLTYKIEAFAGQILGAWILPTRDMRDANWQVISDTNIYRFEPPQQTLEAIEAISRHLLRYGAGYVSFDLMSAGDVLKIIEMNSCGVGTSVWKYWPEQYAVNYARGILRAIGELDLIPRYRALRASAMRENNDAAAVVLPRRPSTACSANPAGNAAAPEQDTGERVFFEELLRSERMPNRRLTKHWRNIAARLLVHARSSVPYYADRLECLFAADGSIDWERWQDVPFIDDADVAENRAQMLSRRLPAEHGAVTHWAIRNKGRPPFTITRSHAQFVIDSIVQTRLYHWHGITPRASMATLLPSEEIAQRSPSWTPFWWSNIKGVEHHGDVALPVAGQLRWLAGLGGCYLRTTADRLRALCEGVEPSQSILAGLKGILISDVVADELRTLCRERLGCDIIDTYRRLEAGFAALRCPGTDTYHAQTETCLVEIIDGAGRPCKPGEPGEIVVTPFYSYAMPLIRYRTGDIAQVATAESGFTQFCGCGRTLPGIGRFGCAETGSPL